MPGFDRTGPEGEGSRTGRQMGKCNKGEDGPETPLGRGPGRGMGRGVGRAGRAAKRGSGRGAGRGPGRNAGQN